VSPSTFEVGLAVTGDNVAPAINWYADVALTFVPVPAL